MNNKIKMKNRVYFWLGGMIGVLTAIIFCIVLAANMSSVSADMYEEIYSYEDLLKIADNPDGNYILMQDIDMSGIDWTPLNFSGSFNGNGHALLNVTVKEMTAETRQTYDGNMKVYDTYFSGFFGILTNAVVSDLNLINYRSEITSDVPCFSGSLAGYSDNSAVTGCTITAEIRLDAHDRMFGVGGVVGYGNGAIEYTDVDVTLICNDTDALSRDEQFLGGAYAAGYFDLNECHIDIDGYVSEHGYTHNGGAAGMYILYPGGTVYEGYLTNTRVVGRISFYEDNTDRRAYCKDFIGEVMNWTYQVAGNSSDFVSDESHDYSVVLVPHSCVQPQYSTQEIEADCENYGYVLYHCDVCGYEYKDNYTSKKHEVANWRTIRESDTEDYGIIEGECELCGTTVRQLTEKLEEEATTQIEPETESSIEETESVQPSGSDSTMQENVSTEEPVSEVKNVGAIMVIAVIIAVAAITTVAIIRKTRR